MQFNAVLGKLLPALTGKENLMLMGIFSYLTETTPEKDRTFRFGIFATFIQILPTVFVPFAFVLFDKLRYVSKCLMANLLICWPCLISPHLFTELFLLCIVINLIGIIYLLFVLREVKHKKKNTDGVDNPAYEKSKGDAIDNQNSNGRRALEMDAPKKPTSCLLDFFNPIVAVECVQMIIKKRAFNARRIIILLLILYFVVQCPSGKIDVKHSLISNRFIISFRCRRGSKRIQFHAYQT